MSATTSGAIKAYVEALGLGVPVFRDGPRPGQAPPYVVVTEGLSAGLAANGNGDFGDPDAPVVIAENVTVDLVQNARAKDGQGARNTERYGLAETIGRRLHGARLTAHPAPVTAVQLQDIDRIPIADNIVRHAIHIVVTRQLLASEVTPA
jgi:hypothetical protein